MSGATMPNFSWVGQVLGDHVTTHENHHAAYSSNPKKYEGLVN